MTEAVPGGRPTVIVVPCRNEADRLQPDRFLAYLDRDPETGFLFVDDASTDDTGAALDGLVASRPGNLAATRLDAHGGKAEAVRRGVLEALATDPRFIGYWDADLSTPLGQIPLLRAPLERDPQVWIVLGSRVRLLGRDIRRRPLRHYLGRAFATAASQALRLPVYDTQCGAKLFRSGPYLAALFGEPFRSRWIFDVEWLARFLARTDDRTPPPAERIVEVPLEEWNDVGDSRLRPSDFARAPAELLHVYLRYMRR